MSDLLLYLFAHHKTAANTESQVTKSSAKWKSHHPPVSQKAVALLGALDIWSMAEHLSGYVDGGLEPDTPFLVSCAEQSLAPLASWDCFICKEPPVLLPW